MSETASKTKTSLSRCQTYFTSRNANANTYLGISFRHFLFKNKQTQKQGWNFIFSFGIFAVRQILESNTVNVSVLCKCWVKNNQIFSLFMCTLLVRFKFHIQGRYTSVWREVAVRTQTFHKLHTWWLIHFLASFFSSAHWPRRNTPF